MNETIRMLIAATGQATFMTMAREHGVECLIRYELRKTGKWESTAAPCRDLLDERAREETTLELLRRTALKRTLTTLERSGIDILIVKGAALAYTHYEAPHLRPCGDVDLFVRETDFRRVRMLLETSGFTQKVSVDRDVHRQRTFVAYVPLPFRIDLHWALSNRPLFASMLSFDECLITAVPIPALGRHALTLDPPRSLLLACIHRVGHHDDSDRLIWLYDIGRISERFSAAEWDLFWRLAREHQVVRVCSESLRMAVDRAGASAEIVGVIPEARAGEQSSLYLGRGASTRRNLWLDMRATKTWSGRIRLVMDHGFPDGAYMREALGAGDSYASLLLAYLRRAVRGTSQLLASSHDQ
jgi:hypothetical protein